MLGLQYHPSFASAHDGFPAGRVSSASLCSYFGALGPHLSPTAGELSAKPGTRILCWRLLLIGPLGRRWDGRPSRLQGQES